MAQYVANPMKLVNVSITSSCEITYYFSNHEFYRIFDIAVDVKGLTAAVQRRRFLGEDSERNAIRIRIVYLG